MKKEKISFQLLQKNLKLLAEIMRRLESEIDYQMGIPPAGIGTITDDCHYYRGSVDKGRYRIFSIAVGGVLYFLRTNILSWYIYKRTDNIGLDVQHLCQNPWCCNPNHLILDTPQRNQIDATKNRHNRKPSNKSHKVTSITVEEIRRRHANGYSVRELSEMYDISPSMIYRYITGKAFK
jgi:hypothetical protein